MKILRRSQFRQAASSVNQFESRQNVTITVTVRVLAAKSSAAAARSGTPANMNEDINMFFSPQMEMGSMYTDGFSEATTNVLNQAPIPESSHEMKSNSFVTEAQTNSATFVSSQDVSLSAQQRVLITGLTQPQSAATLSMTTPDQNVTMFAPNSMYGFPNQKRSRLSCDQEDKVQDASGVLTQKKARGPRTNPSNQKK